MNVWNRKLSENKIYRNSFIQQIIVVEISIWHGSGDEMFISTLQINVNQIWYYKSPTISRAMTQTYYFLLMSFLKGKRISALPVHYFHFNPQSIPLCTCVFERQKILRTNYHIGISETWYIYEISEKKNEHISKHYHRATRRIIEKQTWLKM